MKYLEIVFVLLFSFISLGVFAQSSSFEIVQNMGRGINLGNVLSAQVEGNWSPAVEQQYFNDVASAGFTNVRIPIDFYGNRTSGTTENYSKNSGTASDFVGNGSDFSVSSMYLDRIETVVDWSMNQGLYTVLDFHGAELKSEFLNTFNVDEPAYCAPTSAKRAADLIKFKAIWTAIAIRFLNHSERLIFEIVNEPYFHLSASEMDALNLLIISTIRATGGNNTTRSIIITGGTRTSNEAPTAIGTEVLESDHYLIATFHYYQPFSFTSSTADSKDTESWGTDSDKNTLMTKFDAVLTWSTTHDIPVFVGEFSADNTGGYQYSSGDLKTNNGNVTGFADGGPDNASRVEFHRFVAEQAINRGFSFAVWDSGPKSNKAIHKRNDSPSTVNYNIDHFSVISYNPKETVVSTVVDNSVWVEDVKDALLELGTWPLCYGTATDAIILNPNFECGHTNNWYFSTSGEAVAVYSNASTDSYAGEVGGKLEVTTPHLYNNVLLSNTEYSQNLTGKKLIIQGYAKALGAHQSFKIRVKAIINGTPDLTDSPALTLSDGSLNGASYELKQFEYVVPDTTSSVQIQLLFGEFEGTYLVDNFSVTLQEVNLGLDDFDIHKKIKIVPNPSSEVLNIYTDLNVKYIKLFNFVGQLIHKQSSTAPIQVNNYSKGTYVLRLETISGQTYFKKIIII